MTVASVALDILQALYVLAYLAFEFTLDGVALSKRSHPLLLITSELLALLGACHVCLSEDVAGTCWANAVNEWQSIGELLIVRDGNARNTHSKKLTLASLAARILLVNTIQPPASAD